MRTKKTNFTRVVGACIMVLFMSTVTVDAQGKIMAGAGLNYATEISSIGVGLDGLYLINEEWDAAVGYTYFLEKDHTRWSTLDFDAHYIFSGDESTALYALAGLNILFWTIDYGDALGLGEYGSMFGVSGKETASTTGFNIGLGGRYGLSDKLFLNGELKYVINNTGFVNISAGVLYKF